MNLEQGFTGTAVPIEYNITIDLENDPNFQWGDTWGAKPLVDWNQLQYQNIYKSSEYVASKFTGDFSHLQGFEKIIENIATKTITPLDELISRYNIANEQQEDRDDTNIPQFQNSQ
jgi:hypothetical protein